MSAVSNDAPEQCIHVHSMSVYCMCVSIHTINRSMIPRPVLHAVFSSAVRRRNRNPALKLGG